MIKAKTLAQLMKDDRYSQQANIVGITIDSRKVTAGFVFLAIKGEVSDGHHYIQQAVENGAVAVLVEDQQYSLDKIQVPLIFVPELKKKIGIFAANFYDRPTEGMCVFGVTGTNGKTSISHYIQQLLSLLAKSCGVIGTLGVDYADVHYSTGNTTPDAVTLQHHFSAMKALGVDYAAMEVSSHALHQHRCEGIKFDTVIISNVTHDHLDYHGSLKNYLNAKLQLFQMPDVKVAVVNADDDSINAIKPVLNKEVKCVSYSAAGKNADYRLRNIRSRSNGYEGVLECYGKEHAFEINLLGDFNLSNVLAAAIAVAEQGVSLDVLIPLLKKLKSVPGRMELVQNDKSIIAVVDYAHTPDALENVLQTLKKQVEGKVLLVFGCGGDRDKTKRPLMGKVASKFADYVVVTSDNPRKESPQDIIDEIKSGLTNKSYVVIADRKKAISHAVAQAVKNDCVLVAGKGHEKMQIVGNETIPFDDVEELRCAMLLKGVMP